MLIGRSSLLSLLKAVYQWEHERTQQKGPAQSFSTMNTHLNPSLNTRTTTSNNQEREEIPTRLEEVNLEDISIHFLCTYSTDPNWKQIVSTCNDYGQTLAHIAVTLGYFRLLQHLFKWQIDLNLVDSTGLSALHYAYLFKQEECAKFLIHSGVDRFILDDLGRSPADLDPSLEVRLGSNMDMDSDSSADGAPAIECDIEMPDEAGKHYAKHFLIQQWMREGEDERRDDVPLPRCQSEETSSPPALDSADERVWGVPYDGSSSLVIRTSEGHSTPVVAEEIDRKALIETATPTHVTHPPSPIFEVSPQTQEANRPALSYPLSLSHSESTVPRFTHPTLPFERWQAIREAPWVLANQLEPLNHNGRPILMDWLEDISPPNSKERAWMCQVPSMVDITQRCEETFPQRERGLTHIRSKHLNLRPFLCGGGGDCGTPDW